MGEVIKVDFGGKDPEPRRLPGVLGNPGIRVSFGPGPLDHLSREELLALTNRHSIASMVAGHSNMTEQDGKWTQEAIDQYGERIEQLMSSLSDEERVTVLALAEELRNDPDF